MTSNSSWPMAGTRSRRNEMREETVSSWVKFLALPLFGTLLTGLFTWLQNQREIRENNVRIYAELMSQREGADSALRKDMFSSIIGTFLKPASGSMEDRKSTRLN